MTTDSVLARAGDAGARIADAIRAEIVSGTYIPGERVRQEEIATRFGASRVPVREAFQMLEYEGLITVKPNAGAWVARLTLSECEEIYQMRELIEPLLLSYSAPLLLPEDICRLEELAIEITALNEETSTFLSLDREFHRITYSRADTAQLGSLIEKLWNTTAPYRRVYVQLWDSDSREIANMEHHLLVALLKEQDFEEAQRVLAGHIRRTRRKLSLHPDIFEVF